MPSFDVSADVDWQEVDNAVNQATKEVLQRYDFKGVKAELKLDKSAKTVTLWCSDADKLAAVDDVFKSKLIKRGVSLMALEYKDREDAFGGSARQVVVVQAGIAKEKAKDIVAALKESKLKVQAQIQDEQVRVTGKNRDDLQDAITLLRSKENDIKVPMSYGNFRD
jgi:uncharacterized protein YajQ (UPF0234 family)